MLNAQGDVVAVTSGGLSVVASYTYDAWGRLVTSSGWMASINPLRYRGYYYDTETGFYYVQSRYYDPIVKRFINADEVSNFAANGDFISYNLFAYCGNNPISREDDGGECWHIIIGAGVGLATQYFSDVIANLASGKSFGESLIQLSTWADYGAAAASGALAATGISLGGSVVANAFINGITYFANCDIKGEQASVKDLAIATGMGAFDGLVGGKGANGAKLLGITNTSKEVLKTAVSPKKIAMYTAKIAACKKNMIKNGVKFITTGLATKIISMKDLYNRKGLTELET